MCAHSHSLERMRVFFDRSIMLPALAVLVPLATWLVNVTGWSPDGVPNPYSSTE